MNYLSHEQPACWASLLEKKLTCLPLVIEAGTSQWPLECVIYVTGTKCGQMFLQIVGPLRVATACVKSAQRKYYHVASLVLSAGLTMYGNLVDAKVSRANDQNTLKYHKIQGG